MNLLSNLYWYKAVITRIYDADTIYANVDLGFGIFNRGDNGKGLSVRLAFINAPEIKGEEREAGLVSKEWLESKLPVGREILLHTIKWSGKYGRYIADVYIPDENGEFYKVNDELVNLGLAVYVDY
jgi:micrococcal nuclease